MPLPSVDDASLGRALRAASADSIVGTDLRGTITAWNQAAEHLFGYTAAAAIGHPITLILPESAVVGERASRERAHRGETVRDLEAVRRRRDGVDVSVTLTLAPIADAGGRVIGALHLARPAADRAGIEQASRRLAAIVESSDDAIISKDLMGKVTSWNQAAERIFGYLAPEIIGKSIRTIIPADRQGEEDEVLAHICRGERVDHFETIRRRKDGTYVPVSLTVSPVRNAAGDVIGASKIARDISERRHAEAEREHLLAISQEHSVLAGILNRVGAKVASALDRSAVVRAVIDAATEVTSARYGAFFYNSADEDGRWATLLAAAGAGRSPADDGSAPGEAPALDSASIPTHIVRSDDIVQDARRGRRGAHPGIPEGQDVCSYMSVPVKDRAGRVRGGLFFAHPEPRRFTMQHELLVTGIAGWASLALENARLYLGAQEANRLKDEFLATLSHELRTPLNAIVGYARMLHAGMLPADHVGRALESIARNAMSLTRIVEDVLDVSRFISGKMRLQVQPLHLPDTVRHAVQAVKPAADAKGIHIEMVEDSQVAAISGDPDRLQQVVWNLLSNAVKFTHRGGRIQVRVERIDSHLDLVVSDNGVGIAPAFLPHVFESFRQQDATPSRERGGLGLGLAIARQLVEMHGGTIDAVSAGLDRGATFRVRLPLMAVAHEPLTGGAPARRDDAQAGLVDLSGIRILAVDDEEDSLTMLRDMLEARGALVTTASSAAQALQVLASDETDVLLADLGMPHVDGFMLIEELRRRGSGRTLPAIALTAYVRSHDRLRALESGFHAHLGKPIDPRELTAAIAALAMRREPR